MFIEQADGFSMDVAYMKVLPSKSEEIKESTKRGRAAEGGPPPFCRGGGRPPPLFPHFLEVVPSYRLHPYYNHQPV